MKELEPSIAKKIIERVGGPGQPPEYGLQEFTAGLDPYLSVIRDEYLGSFIKDGGSCFKLVVGVFGGGKTHFLYCVRDIAWDHKFIVSYVRLSPGECPFHQLDAVYKAIARGIVPPLSPDELLSGYEQGIDKFIQSWYGSKYAEYQEKGLDEASIHEALLEELDGISRVESISYAKAMRAAFRALVDKRDDDFEAICQWLKGEGFDRRTHGRFGIMQKIDKSTAFTMIRSLAQWVRQVGYSGIVILLDEGERQASLSSKQRELLLNNLREVIDECGQSAFQNIMIFYAVPDENFLEGRSQIYEALRQRVATVFEELNPAGVKIELDRVVAEPVPFLCEVGQKLARVFEIAYGIQFPPEDRDRTIQSVAEEAYKERFGDIGYKRFFVQKIVKAFHFLRIRHAVPTLSDL